MVFEQGFVVLDGGGDGFVGACAFREVAVQGVAAQEDGEFYIRHGFEEARVPFWGALGAWREVATLARAWVAETHRDQRDQRGIVELLVGELEPFAESLARGVVPGDAGVVRLLARGLTDQEDAGLLAALQQRAGLVGQVLGADRARAGVGDDF